MARSPCKDLQEDLYSYLQTEIDPYDFTIYLEDFAREHDLDDVTNETQFDELSARNQKTFVKWLKTTDKAADWLRQDPIYAPAYLLLHSKLVMPDGSWLIHFTNAMFEGFKYGTTLDGLALSSHKARKEAVDCARNLTGDRTLYDAVFGFAFDAGMRNVLFNSTKYGRNAVLFQTDCGVEAYHDGDNEDQVIFPLCSEYNLILLTDVREGLVVETEDGELVTFPSIAKVIEYVEKREGKQALGLSGISPRIKRVNL